MRFNLTEDGYNDTRKLLKKFVNKNQSIFSSMLTSRLLLGPAALEGHRHQKISTLYFYKKESYKKMIKRFPKLKKILEK